ncbi:membrane protein insertase YidC, partial [Brachyspira intermedia]|uniref:membrane protein insertase YidC n=1 Tax=Brachyspira intermedia TaxID=84377 RepID=UPI0030040306
MVLLDILYNITIYPIEFIIETLFYLFNNVFQYSYPISLFLLSLSVSILSLPLYITAEKWKKEEEIIQSKMKPDIDHIKKNFKGDEKFLLIQACYKIYKYKTVYALRSTLGLLIQIPFFLAAYNFIHNLQGLENISFLLIKDLASPDKLIHIGNTNINILPFIMSFFSLLSGIIYYKRGSFKDNSQIYIIPLIFLILLYNSPSGLLFYWTLNCFFSLVKNIIIKYKNNIIYVIKNNNNFILKRFNITTSIFILLFSVLFLLGNISRKGYLDNFELISQNSQSYGYNMRISYYNKIFRNSDIFGVYIDKKDLTNKNILNITFNDYGSPFGIITLNDSIENIGRIEIKYKLFIKNYIIYILIFFLLLSLIFNNINLLKYLIKKVKSLHIYTIPNSVKKVNNVIIIIFTIILLTTFIFTNISRKGYLDNFQLISQNNQSYEYNMRISYYNKIFR